MLIAIDGSYDADLGLGAWAVILCRRIHAAGGGNPPRLGGLQRRSGGAPPWVDAAHGAEAWALLMAGRWCKRAGLHRPSCTTDCTSLASILAGAAIAGIPGEIAQEIGDLSRRCGLRLQTLHERDDLADLRRELHDQAHAGALRALRRVRERRTARDAEEVD